MKFPASFHRGTSGAAMASLILAIWAGTQTGAVAQVKGKSEPGLKFDAVKFFEHGAATAAGGEGGGDESRLPANRFPVSSTRFIEAQLVFENLRVGDLPAEYELMLGLYTFDNQLISAERRPVRVGADWKFTWISQSYGWPEAGRWSVGTYRFKAWLGKQKVIETAIYLEDDLKQLPASMAGISVRELEFYEGGGFFRPGPAERASSSFARSKTRRIYWVLKGANQLHGVRAQRPNVVGYFYRPDGTLLGETRNRFLIAPEIEEAVLVEGLGWASAGQWEPGRYRFELEQDHQVVEEAHFEITDPFIEPRTRPRAIHFGIIDAGVFAGGEEPPADELGREYSARFDPAPAERIWCELVVVNNPNHTEPHTHRIQWQLFQPDGSLLGEAASEFTIQPEWKTARQKASFRWGGAGSWTPGAYKLRIVIDGQLA
ncbi:MAG: hypothetical protein ACR2RV_17670, partial [Verrucomicrobiales bacterium]